MQKEVYIKLEVFHRGFRIDAIRKMFEYIRAKHSLTVKNIEKDCQWENKAIITLICNICNDTTNYSEIENEIQNEIDDMEILREKIILILHEEPIELIKLESKNR